MKEKDSLDNIVRPIIVETSSINIKPNYDLQISDEYIRNLFDDKYKRDVFKRETFESGDVYDTLTGEKLMEKIDAAKANYPDNWSDHIAETDHIVPVKTIYDKHHSNPFLSDQDLKEIANIRENYSLKSKSTNASKQDGSNSEMIKKQQKNGVDVDRDVQRAYRREELRANRIVQLEATKRTAKNAASEAIVGAKEALEASTIPLAMNLIFNVVQVCDNKKDIKKAMSDVSKTVGTVAVTGSATKLLNTALKNVDNPILQFCLKNNLPAQIVAMTFMIKDDIKAIKDRTISKEQGTSNILSKFAGLVGGKIGTAIGGKAIALLQSNTATQALGTLLATYGGASLIAIPAAVYTTAVAKNLFDEVVGKGSWEAIKNSNIDCQTLATVIKESVTGIKTNTTIFEYSMQSSQLMQNEITENFEIFEQRKNK